jgi:hypothetical protein
MLEVVVALLTKEVRRLVERAALVVVEMEQFGRHQGVRVR